MLPITLSSPTDRLSVSMDRRKAQGGDAHESTHSALCYSLRLNGDWLLEPSRLGLCFEGEPPLHHGLEVSEVERGAGESSVSSPYGTEATSALAYEALTLTLRETVPPGRRLRVHWRVYDGGVCFRYEYPGRDGGAKTLARERTEFSFPAGCRGCDHYHETPYDSRPIDQVGRHADQPLDAPSGDVEDRQIEGSERPLTVTYPDGRALAVAEVRTDSFPRSLFRAGTDSNTIELVQDGNARKTQPFQTPWRVILAGETATELIENRAILDGVAPDPALPHADWIEPGTVLREVTLSTDGARECIDFAAENGIDYVLFDGGWYGDPFDSRSDPAAANPWPSKVGLDGPDPDRLDLEAVLEYADANDVGVWLYLDHDAVERRLDALLPHYRSLGIAGLKFGFVNVGGQEWTAWLHDAVEACAEHELMVNVHDAYRPAGLHRKFPNLLTQEGIRGNEHHPTADHNATLPFTRFLVGPADYTICYDHPENQTTDAHQLALCVIYDSPLQHLFWYDEPADHRGRPELEFFEALPTVWDETIVLDGAIGDHVSIARRRGEAWFVGSITNTEGRTVSVDLDFLDPLDSGASHIATVYRDDPAAEPGTARPDVPVTIEERSVDPGETIDVTLPPSGGLALWITPET